MLPKIRPEANNVNGKGILNFLEIEIEIIPAKRIKVKLVKNTSTSAIMLNSSFEFKKLSLKRQGDYSEIWT